MKKKKPAREQDDETPLWERCQATAKPRALLDDPDRVSPIADRANPYSVRRRPRQLYKDIRTGEEVYRFRGGKNFRRVYPKWNGEGLVSRRHKDDYPLGWAAAKPGPGPYVIRAVVDAAMRDHCVPEYIFDFPDAAIYVLSTLLACLRAHVASGANSTPSSAWPPLRAWEAYPHRRGVAVHVEDREGRHENDCECPACVALVGKSPWSADDVAQLLRLEMRAASAKAGLFGDGFYQEGTAMPVKAESRRVVTSEFRNDDTGEYGPEMKLDEYGRIIRGRGEPLLVQKRKFEPDPTRENRRFKAAGKLAKNRAECGVPIRPWPNAQMRRFGENVVKTWLAAGRTITVCPPETTTEKLHRAPRGRKLQHDRRQTSTERSAERRRLQLIKWMLTTPVHSLGMMAFKQAVAAEHRADIRRSTEPHTAQWSATFMERCRTIAPIGEDAMREHHVQGSRLYVLSSDPRAMEQWGGFTGMTFPHLAVGDDKLEAAE